MLFELKVCNLDRSLFERKNKRYRVEWNRCKAQGIFWMKGMKCVARVLI